MDKTENNIDKSDYIIKELLQWLNCEKNSRVEFCEVDMSIHVKTPIKPYIEFYLLTQGKMQFKIKHKSTLLQKESVLVANAQFGNTGLIIEKPSHYHVLSIDISGNQLLEVLCKNPIMIPRKLYHIEPLSCILNDLAVLYHSEIATKEIRIKNITMRFLLKLSDTLSNPERKDSRHHCRREKIINLIHKLQNNPDLSVKKLGELSQFCPDYVSRLIKQETGLPPIQYIKNLRISRSQKLLIQTDLSIKEIAYSIGFNDPLYFTRIFHQKLGCSPTQFRHNNR